MPKCITCQDTGKSKYYMLKPLEFQCSDCAGDKPKISVQKQHLPIWPRWVCNTHHCGSYNFGQLGRHEMPWCDIVKEHTIGIIKPKTYGGFNGDVSRNWFTDWHEYVNRHNINKKTIKTWKERQRVIGRKPGGRYANRFKRVRST